MSKKLVKTEKENDSIFDHAIKELKKIWGTDKPRTRGAYFISNPDNLLQPKHIRVLS
jgi:hypothetical protein